MFGSRALRLSLLTLLLLAGCGDGERQQQQGAEVVDAGTPDAPYQACVEVPTTLGPTDVTPLGFTAQELLENTLGTYDATLTWGPVQGGVYYADGVSSTALDLELTFSAGEVRYVDATTDILCDGACSCFPHLQVDAILRFTTADGVLDETWDTVLRATRAREASFSVSFDPDDTAGSMSWDSFVIDGYDPNGTVNVAGVSSDGASEGSVTLAMPLSGEGGGAFATSVASWAPPG